MQTGTFTEIALDLIEVPTDRARAFVPAAAEALAGLIDAQGLLHPVTLRRVELRGSTARSFVLVAGLHRLRAFGLLGRAAIPAQIVEGLTKDQAREFEVMENLGRNELNALDRAQHLYELRQVYERMHPGSSRPGRRSRGEAKPGAVPEVFGFAAATAARIGLSKRQINHAVKIWEALTQDSRGRLAGTKTAASHNEIKLLSEQPAKRQAQILDMLLSDPAQANTVADALVLIERGCLPNTWEKSYSAAHRMIAALDDMSLDRVVMAHKERLIASLLRQGESLPLKPVKSTARVTGVRRRKS